MTQQTAATLHQFINGHWIPGNADELVSTSAVDPEIRVASGKAADTAQVTEAFIAAEGARASWSAMPMAERAGYLLRASAYLNEHAEQFGAELATEEGKTLPEGIGEVRRFRTNTVLLRSGV